MASTTTYVVLCALAITAVSGQSSAPPPSTQYTVTSGGSTAAEAVASAVLQNVTKNTNGAVNTPYQAIGSGAGQTSVVSGALDFSVSDIPVSSSLYSQSTAAGRPLDQIPFSLGIFSLVFNLPNFKSGGLQLTPCQVASIFTGQYSSWTASGLSNSTLGAGSPSLPAQNIIPIVRQDSSGTTQTLASWLNLTCPSVWTLGVNTTIAFPASFTKATGSDGVISAVANTPYSVSYVDFGLARTAGITFASLQNNNYSFVLPQNTNFSGVVAELNSAQYAPSFPATTNSAGWATVNIIASRLPSAYPLTSIEYVVVPHDLTSKGQQGSVVKQVITQFLTTQTQSVLLNFGFLPLPSGLLAIATNGTSNLIVAPNGPNLGLPSAATTSTTVAASG